VEILISNSSLANYQKERLECHVYGRLIAIFICSSTMFKMRKLLLQKNKRELSEYKAIGMIQDHVSLLYQAIQRNTQNLTKILIRLFDLLQKNGRKNLIDMRRKLSLILWVLSMSIMGWKTKESCIIFKMKLVRVYLVCVLFNTKSTLRVFSLFERKFILFSFLS
jgi:hypothetical protein